MRFVQINENINLETEAQVWNVEVYGTQEKKIIIQLKCDDAVVQIDEHDLAAIRKLVDQAKYVIGMQYEKHL